VSRPLNIAIAADPELPVPPRLYGGIERVIHFLAEGLTARGHNVTLFAHADSNISGRLVPYGGSSSHSLLDTMRNASRIAVSMFGGETDVIHSFGRLAYLAPLALTSTPKLMSYQRPVTPTSVHAAVRLFGRTLSFSACGRHMIGALADEAPWHVIPNGVPLSAFTYQPAVPANAPFVFLGRVEEIKGTHLAIDIARRAGRALVIAGNIAAEHQEYFDQRIKPSVDGVKVRFIGAVDDRQKNELLGAAAALLMPILWDEPFGIVMAEALACGTPVIGFNRASVPEVVSQGITGWIGRDVEELAALANHVSTLSRRACRTAAESRFSDDVIVGAYEALYLELIARANPAIAHGHLRNV
jgi:glycosyltransferase involved in cell wall biosynthesis